MKQRIPFPVLGVRFFGVFTLLVATIQVLLNPITNYAISVGNGMVNYLRYFPLDGLLDHLPDYFSQFRYMFTLEYLAPQLFSQLLGLLGLLPLVAFLVYLFFLHRNHRHNVLLPLAFLLTAGIGVLALSAQGYAAYNVFDAYAGFYGSFIALVQQYFVYCSGTVTTLFITSLWIGVCLVLALDGFARFRLRWISVFWLVFYILAVLLAPLFSALLIPLSVSFLAESWDTPVYEVFRELMDGILKILQNISLPDLLYHGYCLLNAFIPALLGLLPAFTYLLFWLFGAKRVKKALPANETEEEVEDAVCVTE